MKLLENYINFTKMNLSGKFSLEIFLDILDHHKLIFFKNNHLNLEFSAYFYTEDINQNILDDFKLKKSFNIISEPKSEISFFLAIEDKFFIYGYKTNKELIKLGKFRITNNFLSSFNFKHKCVRNIISDLKNLEIYNLSLLNEIKTDLTNWWNNTSSKINIIDSYRIRKIINCSNFKPEDISESKLYDAFYHFVKSKTWKNKVTFDVYIQNDEIYFNIFIKKMIFNKL